MWVTPTRTFSHPAILFYILLAFSPRDLYYRTEGIKEKTKIKN